MFKFFQRKTTHDTARSRHLEDSNSVLETKVVLDALDRSQAVIHFETDGTILFANDNFLNAMGYEAHEILGRKHSIFVEPGFESSPEYAQFWESLRRGEFQTATYKRIAKGGREIWIQATYNPILDEFGNVKKVIKFASDVTEQMLQSADAKGQIDAVDKSQAVISFEVDGTILTANSNFLNAVGYQLSEIQGQKHSLFVDAETKASNEYHEFWEALRRGEFQAGEFKRVGKGGRSIWIQASYNPIFAPDGRVLKVVKFASDITAAVQARDKSNRVGAIVDEKLDRIVAAIEDAQEQSGTASSASNRTLETVQSIAAATAQFEVSAEEISRNMQQSKGEVDRAILEAEGADESTRDLTNAAKAMNSVVEMIQAIAGQIKLLSLNATIEAASAGESGKGFAVVASEVKSLANQVAKATDQISTEINDMQSVCETVVSRIERIKDAVQVVENSVTSVVGSVDEQAQGTRSIAEQIQATASEVEGIHKSLSSISETANVAKGYADEGNELFSDLRESTGQL